jgi:hypothetical protein
MYVFITATGPHEAEVALHFEEFRPHKKKAVINVRPRNAEDVRGVAFVQAL